MHESWSRIALLVVVLGGAAAGRARAQSYQPELEADPFVLTSDPTRSA